MRAHVLASVSVLTSLALVAIACGGKPAPATKSPETAASGSTPETAPSSPTTTTMTLGDGGDLQGAKLTASSSHTIENKPDASSPGPQQGEPGRSVKDIQAIVVSHRDEARACYDNALKTHPGIEGDLDIKWTIDPSGKVTDISVDTTKSSILEPSVGKCIMDIIKKLKFAESAKGFETRAHYPFNFHPRNAPPGKPGGGT